jgi:hypothetical protein
MPEADAHQVKLFLMKHFSKKTLYRAAMPIFSKSALQD